MSEAPSAPDRPPILPQGMQGWFWLVVKIVVSVSILAAVLSRVDFARVGDSFATLSLPFFLLSLVAMAAANCLGGYRWSVLTQKLDARMSARDAIGMYLAAIFVGQALPSTLGVDAVRGWLASRKYAPLSQIAGGIATDRAFGLIALGLLLLAGAPRLFAMGDDRIGQAAGFALAMLAIAVIGAVITVAVLLRMKLSGPLAHAQGFAKTVLSVVMHRQGVIALAISLTVHLMLVISIVMIADSLGARIGALDALATIPAAMLIAAIPISINGWGLREGAMVACLGLAGIPASEAFIVSILFGIGQFIVALPGAAYWIFARKTGAR